MCGQTDGMPSGPLWEGTRGWGRSERKELGGNRRKADPQHCKLLSGAYLSGLVNTGALSLLHKRTFQGASGVASAYNASPWETG